MRWWGRPTRETSCTRTTPSSVVTVSRPAWRSLNTHGKETGMVVSERNILGYLSALSKPQEHAVIKQGPSGHPGIWDGA